MNDDFDKWFYILADVNWNIQGHTIPPNNKIPMTEDDYLLLETYLAYCEKFSSRRERRLFILI